MQAALLFDTVLLPTKELIPQPSTREATEEHRLLACGQTHPKKPFSYNPGPPAQGMVLLTVS